MSKKNEINKQILTEKKKHIKVMKAFFFSLYLCFCILNFKSKLLSDEQSPTVYKIISKGKKN